MECSAAYVKMKINVASLKEFELLLAAQFTVIEVIMLQPVHCLKR